MDAMNSLNVDLLPSAMVIPDVDAADDLFTWCRSGFKFRIWSCSWSWIELVNIFFDCFEICYEKIEMRLAC
jgi:hypothetical protein